jgi:hypothetical protein
MSHFAKLDENNIVLAVHVVNNEVITIDGAESEQVGIEFLTGIHGHANWKQTSYNGNFRKQYAGIGYEYDEENDVFISPRPFDSWTLDQNFDWQPPVPRPQEGLWTWNEENQEWEEIN